MTTRRLFLLGGLAILATVLNHSTHWGFIAMTQWTDIYYPGMPVNYDQFGVLTYYSLLTIEKLALFSVPAFLFISGFFAAYAARGSQASMSWKTAVTRTVSLFIPYALWSIVIFSIDAWNGDIISPDRYLLRLLYGGAIPHYFFVPLLCQFYLLSPLVVPVAKTHARLLLLGSGLVQLGMTGLMYLGLLVEHPMLEIILKLMRHWSLFPMWAFFFTLGVVSGLQLDSLKQWAFRLRWVLLTVAIVSALLSIVEADILYRMADINWRDNPLTLPSSLYAISFILCYLAFERISIPFPQFIHQLSQRTFGIYLLHTQVLVLVGGLLLPSLIPQVLPYQIVIQPILITAGIGIPFLFMTAIAKSPARRFHRYLFG